MQSVECEVCGSSRQVAVVALEAQSGRLRRFSLCATHATLVRERGASTAEEVLSLFLERDGRRSLLSRRGPLERRQFPPRPEGRRRGEGRRDADEEAAGQS